MREAFDKAKESLMYDHVLLPVALDHNPNAEAAFDVATALAGETGKITVLSVVELVPGYVDAHVPPELRAETIDQCKDRVRALTEGRARMEPLVLYGHPAQSILDFADNNEVGCIVIASHKPGLQDYLIGSTAARVVRHAHCAVHVVR
jgi:nucleotide-binding universal stress UspA family protein